MVHTIGDVLRKSRLEHGWSQKELAERIDITQRQLMALENNQSYPKFETLVALIDELHIPPEQILYAEKPTEEEAAKRLYHQLLSYDEEDRKTVIQTATVLIQRLKETKGY